MDFLDPRKRRGRHIRLLVGYALVAVAIALATLILAYGASGYGFNAKTGNVIQSGLLFVDSKPGGANIDLSGVSQHPTTSSRLILPAGTYKLTLSKSGYRPWQRTFALNEGSIARYVYPFLFPEKPTPKPAKTYPAQPALMTQSPDQHWLLIQTSDSSSKTLTFEQFDTTSSPLAPTNLALPENLAQSGGTFTDVEWSTDNKHLLLKHDYDGGSEFIVLDRSDPTKSINLNKLFNISPDQVALRNKKIDNFYIYNKAAQTLSVADANKATVASPFLKHVLAFKPYGNNLLSYVTDAGAPAGYVTARIWDTSRSYPFYTFKTGNNYLLDAAQYSGHWYYVAGSDTSDRINIYKDPLNSIKDPSIGKAIPLIALRDPGANKLSFSNNTRFIGAQAGQVFAVYDLETASYYHYTLATGITSPMSWMDGHRYIGQTQDGNILAMDYDGINRQVLTPTSWPKGAVFSKDYNTLFTLAPDVSSGGVALDTVDMRAGSDLPKASQ